MDQNRLFVGNLPFQITEQDLIEFFSGVGVVLNAQVVFDKATGRSRGFGFVEYSNSEEAQKAVEEYNGKDLEGRPLTVNIARPRDSR